MPAATYLLMALEAARQLSDNRDTDAYSLCLSNVEIIQQLPLSVFPKADAALEIQLIARQMNESKFAFEIFSQNSADENLWIRHCHGDFEVRAVADPPVISRQKLLHDQGLLDHARKLEPSVGVDFSNLELNLEGSSGDFKCGPDNVEAYAIDPTTLTSILGLPPMSLLSQNLPAKHHLTSIASITMKTLRLGSECGRFATRVKPSEFCNVESDIEIIQYKRTISLKGLRYRAAEVILQKPSLNPLFFKSELLPDITRLSAAAPMSISRCARLLTHKWPMCDIVINDVPECCTISILKAFGTASSQARSYLRSIKCSLIPPDVESDRIQLIDGSDMASKYHMVIAQDDPLAVQLGDQLLPKAFLCIPKARLPGLMSSRSASLEVVCDITGLGSDPWVLLRKATDMRPAYDRQKVALFTDQHGAPSLDTLGTVEAISLDPAAVTHFCKQNSYTRFDVIVIDSPGSSVITTWTGALLIPWLQKLLKSADSILWVTRSSNESPWSKLAGSLLRTLQAEQPSLKVSWLIIDEVAEKSQDVFVSQVEQAFVRMVGGENELVTRTGDSGLEILRYLPDDDLSGDTGLSLPRKVRSPLGEADYFLGFVAPGEPAVLSSKASSSKSLSGDAIEVLIEASVVDTGVLHMVNCKTKTELPGPLSGLFFAGKVLSSEDPDHPPESHVIGWHPDHTHCKKVSVRSHHICRYPSTMQPSQAASGYAATAFASCIVDGAARARPGETFLLKVQGPLLDTIKQFCKRSGASVLNPCSESKADFVVTSQDLEGVRVNGRPIGLDTYLLSNHGRAMLQRSWLELVDLQLEVDEYEIDNYKDAFYNAKQPCSTVLLHRDAANIVDHVPIYNKALHKFSDNANYIVIGGLGGLGRFICSWMIENGAKHIIAISRSGAGTLEARDTMSAMNASGASIQCIKADACDRKAISEILSSLRSKRPIKGVINLAMVLAGAPMATMTAGEWDHGLRVKIDSSWILHEETLQDRLDFFILFSSIASVLGNRSQGNYNVSNTFLNALAEYRQSLDLPGISVALGAMSKSPWGIYPAIHRKRI